MSRSDFDFESRLVPLLVWYGQARGLDTRALIEKLRLPADVLAQPPGKVQLTTPVSVAAGLADELAAQTKDEHFGVSLAEAVPRGAYGVAEFLIRATASVGEGFEHLVRFSAILAPSQTFRFEVSDGEGVLHHYATTRPGALGRHLNEYTSAILAKALFDMADASIDRAWFTNPRPASVERLQQYFRTTRLEFDAPTNGFAVPKSALSLPVRGGDPALFAFLEEHARTALASRPKTDDLVDKLRHAIRDALAQGEPNIERLAARMNLSARTLQRRLSDLQTSFQETLDGVRFDLARAYLKDPRLDVSQVAWLLGYSELRAFDRAFKRWANVSPGEWRSQ